MNCSVSWCDQTACMFTGMCRVHTQELEIGDPRLGPVIKFQNSPGGQPQTGDSMKFFSMVTDKDGDDQLSEVSKDFFSQYVSIEGDGKTQLAFAS